MMFYRAGLIAMMNVQDFSPRPAVNRFKHVIFHKNDNHRQNNNDFTNVTLKG
jgi:hypothetical protein